jgi:hypothetical protein
MDLAVTKNDELRQSEKKEEAKWLRGSTKVLDEGTKHTGHVIADRREGGEWRFLVRPERECSVFFGGMHCLI